MIIQCKTIEQLLQRTLACPRRARMTEDEHSLGFKTDEGTHFRITRADFDASINNDMPYRTRFFVNAIGTEAGKLEYCDSLNYGKPDWKS